MFHGNLARWPFSQSTSKMIGRHDSSTSSHVLHTWPFHELLLASFSQSPLIHLLKLDSSLISRTHPSQKKTHIHTKKMIENITIKFGMKLKPIQDGWKSQLYIPL